MDLANCLGAEGHKKALVLTGHLHSSLHLMVLGYILYRNVMV